MSKVVIAILWSTVLFACMGLNAPGARAEGIPNTPAWNANVGFVSGTGLVLILTEDGSFGGGLDLVGRYGIPAGPVVVAPGARFGGYYLPERFIGLAMPTLRVTLPLGPLAPYGQGGLGFGGLTNPGEGGMGWLVGGGLMIHLAGVISFGVEVNYQGIEGTNFRVFAIGPTLVIGG